MGIGDNTTYEGKDEKKKFDQGMRSFTDTDNAGAGGLRRRKERGYGGEPGGTEQSGRH